MRYLSTVILVLISLLLVIIVVARRQDDTDVWITETLRVQLGTFSNLASYSGCYMITGVIDKRALYQGFHAKTENARFGYCQEDRKWYDGGETSFI